ncbi:MAG: VacJ family lipoprotein [Pseudomonadota bacterium]
MSARMRIGGVLLVMLALAGCSAERPEDNAPPTMRYFTDADRERYAQEQFAVYDPAEGTNKYMYKLNAQLDRYVLIPVVDAYTYVTPVFVRQRVSNFFLNVGEIGNFTNAVMQASPGKASTTLGRFVVNTTVGLLGTFDVASEMGLHRQPEDFGQTLGYWGAGPGPYIVLPFFGPSNLRDTTGTIVDLVTLSLILPNEVESSPTYGIIAYGVQPVNMRYTNSFRYFESGTPFEYEIVRYIVSHGRTMQIAK